MKAKTDSQREHYHFRRPQVLSVELGDFLRLYEPAQLNPFTLRSVFGRLSLKIEGAADYGDLCTIPETRVLIQALDSAWPWAGFFLDLTTPFGSARGLGRLPMLAYALCVVDVVWIANDQTHRCAFHFNQRQFARFRDQAFAAIEFLGMRAEIPSEVLAGRKEAIASQLNRILEIV